MQRRLTMIGLMAAMMLGTGCSAGARIVRATPQGGDIEMWGPLMPATREGRNMLVEHCDGRYILQEETLDGAEVRRAAFRCGEELTVALR